MTDAHLGLFDDATSLGQVEWNELALVPKLTNSKSFAPGEIFDRTEKFRGKQYIICKADEIYLDGPGVDQPVTPIVFGTYREWKDTVPRAFFILCKKLTVRLTGESIAISFPYSSAPPRAVDAPTTWPRDGRDGADGESGYPELDSFAFKGPPIHFAFNQVEFVGNPPKNGDKWLKIFAFGNNGQDGGRGGESGAPNDEGGLWGREGWGGDAGHGFGGGQFLFYAPDDQYKLFKNRTQFHITGGKPGTPGKRGTRREPAPPAPMPQDGKEAQLGREGSNPNFPERHADALFP